MIDFKHIPVYVIKVGSHANGTATKDSDVDIRTVFVPPLFKMLAGFPTEEIEEYKTPDGMDVCEYPISQFLRLCHQGNPNILEWLFVPEDCLISVSDDFKEIVLDHRDVFLTKRLYPRFKGYAESHFQKMQRGTTPNLGAKRKENLEKFGYSTKNAQHLIRLARTGCEVLETGKLNVRRPDAKELLDIRNGKWPLDKIIEEGNKLMERMDLAFQNSKLPEELPIDYVIKMMLRLVEKQNG